MKKKRRKPTASPPGQRTVCQNRKARHDYIIVDELEAGLALEGTEVKSLRAGRASLQEAHARIREGEVWLLGAHIQPYEHRGYADHDPTRKRKLLLHAREIRRLKTLVERKGYTLIPLRIYFNSRGLAKCALAVAKGKRQYDKRETLRKRDAKRAMEQARKRRSRSAG